MSLSSWPQKDGTHKVTVDWPYYTSKRSKQYYQHHDKDGAHAAAVVFADRRKKDGALSVEVVHNPDRQHYLCIYIVER